MTQTTGEERAMSTSNGTVAELEREHETAMRELRIEECCEVMHDAYERAAVGAGWETNPASRKPWSEVPIENQTTMRAAVAALLDHLDRDYDKFRQHSAQLNNIGWRIAVVLGYVEIGAEETGPRNIEADLTELIDIAYPPEKVLRDAEAGAHTHTTLVEGCYRCDLNKDEIESAHEESRKDAEQAWIEYRDRMRLGANKKQVGRQLRKREFIAGYMASETA